MMTPRRNAALSQGSGHAPSLLFSGTWSPHAFMPGYQPPLLSQILPSSLSSSSSFSINPQAPHTCAPHVLRVLPGGGSGRGLLLI